MFDEEKDFAADEADSQAREPRWQRDRQAKEELLIQAFDRLIRSQGSHAITANAVIKEAGVGKSLLYGYFGSLAGLGKAWAGTGDFLPSEEEVTGGDIDPNATLADTISGNYRRYAAALRGRPQTLEILATELSRPNEVTEALRDARKDLGRRLHSYFPQGIGIDDEEVVALLLFVYAAITYMSLRSVHTPDYFFLNLSKEEDWDKLDRYLRIIVSKVLGDAPVGKRTRPKATTKSAPKVKPKTKATRSKTDSTTNSGGQI